MLLGTLMAVAFSQAAAGAPPLDPATLGPKLGEQLPAFSAIDQAGRQRDLASLMGPNGLVLVFFRSADW